MKDSKIIAIIVIVLGLAVIIPQLHWPFVSVDAGTVSTRSYSMGSPGHRPKRPLTGTEGCMDEFPFGISSEPGTWREEACRRHALHSPLTSTSGCMDEFPLGISSEPGTGTWREEACRRHAVVSGGVSVFPALADTLSGDHIDLNGACMGSISSPGFSMVYHDPECARLDAPMVDPAITTTITGTETCIGSISAPGFGMVYHDPECVRRLDSRKGTYE